MGVPVLERVMIGSRLEGSLVGWSEDVSVWTGCGTTLRWLRFLRTVPLFVVTVYDLGADVSGSATPSVLCPPVLIHTSVPAGRSGSEWVLCRLS